LTKAHRYLCLSASEGGEFTAVDLVMRMKIQILAGSIYLLCTVAPLLAANAPVDLERKRRDSLRSFRKAKAVALPQSYPGVKYRIDPELAVPRWLDGNLSQGLTKGEPVEMTYQFFEKNRELYGLSDSRSELKVTRVDKDELGKMVVLQQYYRNVEVWNAVVKVSFGRDGNLCAISGFTYPNINVSTTPAINANVAEAIVKQYLLSKHEGFSVVSREQKVFPYQDKYFLVWLVKASVTGPTGAWEYFIDAHTGQILHKANRMRRINSRDSLQRAIFAQATAGIDKSVPAP
jgi:hypothetical protein